MKQTIQEYLTASCGIGKYYSSSVTLLKKLRKTKSKRWGSFEVPELIKEITENLKLQGISTEEIA
ncbi:MAG: hypothetical protein HGGPFJEG_03082 [Ignavibacteria bacterium]|nr:hypothetical protein [Ignavibacteria bacterium]